VSSDTLDAAVFDPPDADLTYAHYLETCRRLGVTPTPRERAKALIREAIAARRAIRPPTH
jgi:hypothetical protein